MADLSMPAKEPEKLFMRRAALALVGVTCLGALFYLWLLFTRWQQASQWGDFGSAVGPFVALLNVGALLAALYSIALQREELRETRAEMVAQREEFKRSAEAQEALAKSQAAAAEAQILANKIALNAAPRLLAAEHAQRTSNVASLLAAEANMLTSLAAARVHVDVDVRPQQLLNLLSELANQRTEEERLIAGLEQSLANFGDESEEEDEHA
jgi:hypothetical protein